MTGRLLIVGTIAFTSVALSAQAPRAVAFGDNLVVEGVPPIPTSLAEEVRRYTDARAATFVAWHP